MAARECFGETHDLCNLRLTNWKHIAMTAAGLCIRWGFFVARVEHTAEGQVSVLSTPEALFLISRHPSRRLSKWAIGPVSMALDCQFSKEAVLNQDSIRQGKSCPLQDRFQSPGAAAKGQKRWA